MIKNKKQLKVAESKLQGLRASQNAAEAAEDKSAYEDLIRALESDIADFRGVESGAVKTFNLHSLDDLGEAVIKARIARRWTQSEFASELGVTEQNVQRDEAQDYENAGLARLAEILDALEYELVGCIRPKQTRVVQLYAGQSSANYDLLQAAAPEASTPTTMGVTVYWGQGSFVFPAGPEDLSFRKGFHVDAQTDRPVSI